MTAPDQCCINARKPLPGRRPHMTQSGLRPALHVLVVISIKGAGVARHLLLGRLPHARSSPNGCAASACSFVRGRSGISGRVAAFHQGLQQSGRSIGRNVWIDTRWATNADDLRKHAAELAALASDVILAFGSSTVGALLQATRTVPIIFPVAADPDSLSRPGGNATGFMNF
jgi:hypothetical protein